MTQSMTVAEYRHMMGLDNKVRAQGKTPGQRTESGMHKAVWAQGRMPKPGRSHKTEGMNKTEAKYAHYLENCIMAGEILAWKYESLKFRLADKTWYTPDFEVQYADGRLEIHEVKGYWEEDARVKIKAVAEQFPWYVFRAVKLGAGGRWEIETFGRAKKDVPCPARRT